MTVNRLYILAVYAVPGVGVPTILSSCFKSIFLQKVIHFCEDIFLTDFKQCAGIKKFCFEQNYTFVTASNRASLLDQVVRSTNCSTLKIKNLFVKMMCNKCLIHLHGQNNSNVLLGFCQNAPGIFCSISLQTFLQTDCAFKWSQNK